MSQGSDLFVRGRHYVAPRIQALQTSVSSASRAAMVFSCQLTCARLSFLRQHAIKGSPVLPAAAIAEIATAAVRLLGEDVGSSSGSIAAVAALAVSQQLLLIDCNTLTTTVQQPGAVTIATESGATVTTCHAALAVSAVATAEVNDPSRRPAAAKPGPLARIVRASPLLADAATPSRPLAALQQSPGARDGFWTHPGLLSAALVLADTCEERPGSASLLFALGCYVAAAAAAQPVAESWAAAVEASGASIRSSEGETAAMQVCTRSFTIARLLSRCFQVPTKGICLQVLSIIPHLQMPSVGSI